MIGTFILEIRIVDSELKLVIKGSVAEKKVRLNGRLVVVYVESEPSRAEDHFVA